MLSIRFLLFMLPIMTSIQILMIINFDHVTGMSITYIPYILIFYFKCIENKNKNIQFRLFFKFIY